MLKIKNTNQFKRDLKKFQHNKTVQKELNTVLGVLLNVKQLAKKYHDHPLSGNWIGFRECHVKPDVLLIYTSNKTTLFLERIGSHSELFS
jgi:mRNA interferase YafQ